MFVNELIINLLCSMSRDFQLTHLTSRIKCIRSFMAEMHQTPQEVMTDPRPGKNYIGNNRIEKRIHDILVAFARVLITQVN